MGILKINRKDYFKMKQFYNNKILNKKIDLTSFLNIVVKNNIAKIKCSLTKKYWYEIDTIKDLKITSKKLINHH